MIKIRDCRAITSNGQKSTKSISNHNCLLKINKADKFTDYILVRLGFFLYFCIVISEIDNEEKRQYTYNR